jgi:hypothetical protein
MTTENMHEFAPTTEELTVLVNHYNSNNKKLPTKYITCTRTGEQVMMFGTNLESRIAKFGGLENLLLKFISKKAIAADKEVGIVHDDQPKSNAGFKTKVRTKESIIAEIAKLTALLNSIPDTRTEDKEVRAELNEDAEIEAEVTAEKQYGVESDITDVAAELVVKEALGFKDLR